MAAFLADVIHAPFVVYTYSLPSGRANEMQVNTCITVRIIKVHTIKHYISLRPCHLLIVVGVIGCSSSPSSDCPTVMVGSIVNPRAFTPCAAPLASTAFLLLSKAPDLSPEDDCELLFDVLSDFSSFFSPCFLTRRDIAFRRASMYVSYLNISLWI